MTSRSTAAPSQDEPVLAPDELRRYRCIETLGRGGMATIYAAIDSLDGSTVALKRLEPHADPEKHRRNRELFEREFHALSQLSHPHVVQVHDFGVDDIGAFYTMEMLDGGDVYSLAPLPWREVCALARDVCSALSLLHSRRLVHRDVSPRNIRRDSAGRVKLLDFGAIAPTGPSKLLIGTPPCCAPESLHMQALDARTDLYALGATLFYALVGVHAYPAATFNELTAAWANGHCAPSELIAGIPTPLDTLIADLLRTDPDARPTSAAEVVQRLEAIDGVAAQEHAAVAQAYLVTPALVGRDEALRNVAEQLQLNVAGRRGSILIEGQPGVGRTRFLDACLRQASTLGMCVVRVDADDVAPEQGVMGALVRQLARLMPGATQTAEPFHAQLSGTFPELYPGLSVEGGATRPQLQQALCKWLEALSRQSALAIAVDDIQRIDEPSSALLAALATRELPGAITLLLSAASTARWSAPVAAALLREVSTEIVLAPLTKSESLELVRSLFGDAPHSSVLAHHAHALCAGNPRDLLRFVQHLVDRGDVRYERGAWTLRGRLDPAELPASLAQTLQSVVDALSPTARELACALALCPDKSFSFEECRHLIDVQPTPSALAALGQVVEHGVARALTDGVQLAQTAWIAPLTAAVPRERQHLLHVRLAGLLSARGENGFWVGQQLLLAGHTDEALDSLVPLAEAIAREDYRATGITPEQLRNSVRGYRETMTEALEACRRSGRPRRDSFLLLRALTSVNALSGVHDTLHLSQMFELLARESGLEDWQALSEISDPQARLHAALTRAQARFDATPPHERVLDVTGAIRALATAIFSALSTTGPAFDLAYLRSFPNLEPYAPLSPALALVSGVVDGMFARMAGRIEAALVTYGQALELISTASQSGLSPTLSRVSRLALLNRIAVMEAGLGQAQCLSRVAMLEQEPDYQVNAALIRRLYALFEGDAASAARYARAADQLRIELGLQQIAAGTHVSWEIDAYVLSEDLTGLRRAIDELSPLAAQHAGWRPVLLYAGAVQHRICGAHAEALAQLESTLMLAACGEHQLWRNVAALHVLELLEVGDKERALSSADAHAQRALTELQLVPDDLQLARALAHAHAGLHDAGTLVDDVIARFHAAGIAGLRLGHAHEVRARCALVMGKPALHAKHLALCAERYRAHGNAALIRKLQRLTRGAQGRARDPDDHADIRGVLRQLERLETGPRRQCILEHLAVESGASGGALFMLHEGQLTCQALLGPVALVPERWSDVVRECFFSDSNQTLTRTDARELAEDACIVPLDHGQGVIGVALLCGLDRAPSAASARLARQLSSLLT